MNPPPRRHGSIAKGRLLVGLGTLMALGANAWIFRLAGTRPHPETLIQVVAVLGSLWLLAGAGGLMLRKIWGRYLVLGILNLGVAGFALAAFLLVLDGDPKWKDFIVPLLVSSGVYLAAALLLAKAHHVRRLNSRAWD